VLPAEYIEDVHKRHVLPHNLRDVLHISVRVFGRVEDEFHLLQGTCGFLQVDLHACLLVGDDVADVVVLLVLDVGGGQEPVDKLFQLGLHFLLLVLLALEADVVAERVLLLEDVAFDEQEDVEVGLLAQLVRVVFGELLVFVPLLVLAGEVHLVPVHDLIAHVGKGDEFVRLAFLEVDVEFSHIVVIF